MSTKDSSSTSSGSKTSSGTSTQSKGASPETPATRPAPGAATSTSAPGAGTEGAQSGPAPSSPLSGDQVREALLTRGVRPSGNTAAGLAASPEPAPKAERETAKEPADAEDLGSILEAGSNSEAQGAAAAFTPSGSLPYAHVPSPTGPMPASVSGTPEAAQTGVDAMVEATLPRTSARRRLSDEDIAGLTKPELRAIAYDRGYDTEGTFGRSGLIRKFQAAQEEDKSLVDDAPAETATSKVTAPAVSGGSRT